VNGCKYIDCFYTGWSKVMQPILKYWLMVAIQYNLIGLINTQYRCDYTIAHASMTQELFIGLHQAWGKVWMHALLNMVDVSNTKEHGFLFYFYFSVIYFLTNRTCVRNGLHDFSTTLYYLFVYALISQVAFYHEVSQPHFCMHFLFLFMHSVSYFRFSYVIILVLGK
jgi:hypothetical protein